MAAATFRAMIVVLLVGMFVPAAAPSHADEADDQYAVAAGLYDRQQWKAAVDEFQTFLQKFPKDSRSNQAVFFLGETLLQVGKLDEARQQFQAYAQREPDGKFAEPALFRSGEAAFLDGKLDDAKLDLDAYLTKYPADRLNAYVLPYLGDIALSKSDAARAAEHYRDGLKRFPEGKLQDDCRFGLARALEKQNQAEEAERLYLAVAGKPGSSLADAAQFQLAALQYATGRFDQALENFAAFEGRLAASPWRPNARLGQGRALLKLNRSAEAVKRFDDVLATESAGDELLRQALRGKIQAELQMADYAALDRDAEEFDKRFSKSADRQDVQRMVARSLVERREFARAVGLLEPLVAGDRTWKQAGNQESKQEELENRYLLAVSYEGLKRNEEALAALAPVVGAAAGQLKADAQLTYGSLLLAAKKYAEAIPPLEAFWAGKPTGDAAVKGAGELAIGYARSGQLERAKKLYAELIEQFPKHPLIAPTTEQLAEAAYDANDAAWSAELSSRLAAAGDSTQYEVKGKMGLGWSRFKAGKLAEAAATFGEVLDKKPDDATAAEAALVRGRILDQLGESESALAMYELVIDKYPTSQQHAESLMAAARLHGKLKQNQQAAAIYQRLATDYPQFPKLDAVLYQWAWATQEIGKLEDADRLFDRVRQEFPQSRFSADAACRLAQRAFDKKEYPRAGELLDGVLAAKTEPTVREYALFLRGEAAAAKADWPKVREAFEAALSEFPENRRRLAAEFWVAEAYYRQADYAAAGSRLEQLAKQIEEKREPWMATILLRRAQVLAQQNQWDEAQPIAAKIEADFPNFQQQYEVDYLLGRCLANRADFEAARLAYGKVVHSAAGAKTETAAMAQWMIGETYFHQKNYEAAYHEYMKVDILYAFPTWQAAAVLQAGKCHELLGDAKQAADLYERVLKVYPNTPFAEQATQRLAMLKKKP